MNCIKINLFYFVFLIFYYRNMKQVWNFLIEKYGSHNFVIHILGKKIFLVNQPHILDDSHLDEFENLTRAQKNLYCYLGLEPNSNNYYQWISTQIRFRNMLDNSIETITKIIESNQNIFIKTHYTLNEAVSIFIDRILAELIYGQNVDHCLFSNTCAMICHYFNQIRFFGIFYFPIIGSIYRSYLKWIYRQDFDKIGHNLAKLYENSDGLMIDLAYDIYENRSIDIHKMINTTTLLYCRESTYYKAIVLEYLIGRSNNLDEIMSKHCQYPLQYKNISNNLFFYHSLNIKKYFASEHIGILDQHIIQHILLFLTEIKGRIQMDRTKNWYKAYTLFGAPLFKNIYGYDVIIPKSYPQKNLLIDN